MKTLKSLWQADMPEISERYRPLAALFVIIYAALNAIMYLAAFHFVYLGPGLGDVLTYDYVLSLLDTARSTGEGLGVGPLLYGVLAFAIIVNMTFRALVTYRAYRAHRASFGQPLPLNELVTYVVISLLNFAIAGVATLAGYSWQEGMGALNHVQDFVQRSVAWVPTIVELPRLVAFGVVIMAQTFVHYWMHRISHVQRFMWLVIHRPHHITEDISPITTLPSVFSFPLALFLIVPYIFVFSAISKLFAPEPFLIELLALQIVTMIAEIYSHAPAFYNQSAKTPWLRFLSFSLTLGPYHVLHHASDRDERFKHVAYTSNLGPGPFCCWDILFGTYRELPAICPPTGLTDLPKLVKNPLRLLAAGIAQIAYELYWNKSWRTRFWILFGSTDYYPPITKDFMLLEHVHFAPNQPKPRYAGTLAQSI
jgi:sterol desaturase/sphingolipid hydroxylase (fatty acid hydroxylase superfamily)